MAVEEDLCIHELDPRWCSICLHGLAQKPHPPPKVFATFRARFDGDCPECDLPIRAPALVCKREHWDGRTDYVHQYCGRPS